MRWRLSRWSRLSKRFEGRAAEFYGGAYFGEGRDGGGTERRGRSGYPTYDRVSSNADISAYVVWRNFASARRSLDVGCAKGFLVEALSELGMDALGCDSSQFAVDHAPSSMRGRIRRADPRDGLPYGDDDFDVVTVLETLEHLPPESVPAALGEIRRVCRGFVYATIPSFGPSGGPGPDGFFEGKVRPERQLEYEARGPGYQGPVAFADLARDAEGDPVEGHLTIASYSWWTARFAEAGFSRRTEIEARIHEDIAPAGLATFWNLYVFSVPGSDEELARQREPGQTLVQLGLHHPLFGS